MKFEHCNKKATKLIQLLMEKIQSSEINDSIDFSYYLGEILFYNQIPLFDISDIEERLIEETYSYINNSSNFNIENNGFLFVATEVHLTGGHTRLMENLSLMLDKDQELIVTKSMNREIKNRLTNFFPKIIECYRDDKENSISYINKLLDNFLKYDSIILNIHPEDIYTVIACGIAKKIKKELKIYFVNHADHAFTYGTTVSDFWFEISLRGNKIDDLRNIKGKRTFLGIPINKTDNCFFQKINYASLSKAKNFITAGSSIKYKPFENQSIFLLINKLLESNSDFYVNVIGVDLFRNYWWWFTKLKFFNRLKLYKSLPYEKYIEVTKKADCYIDSHPMPGGTAFVEQFLNGILCIGLKSYFFGYTPLEKIKKEKVEEVVKMFSNPPADEEILSIQKLTFEVHGFNRVKNRFNSTIEREVLFKNPMIDYVESQKLVFFTNKNFDVSIDFFKFLFIRNKFLFIKILFFLNPLAIINLLEKYLKKHFKKVIFLHENKDYKENN